MIDTASLRRLAQAALSHGPMTKEESAYFAACSPDVLLALLAEVERLTEALKRYGKHDNNTCEVYFKQFRGEKVDCTCGFESALTGGL